MKWLTGLSAIVLAAIGVFAAGGALDIPANLGVMASLDSTVRMAAAILAVGTIVLSLRIWLRIFNIETPNGLSDNS